MVEMVEIVDGRLGKRSVERERYVITLDHCEIWSHFTRTLYFHSPWARDNTVATREISRHYITLTYYTIVCGKIKGKNRLCIWHMDLSAR